MPKGISLHVGINKVSSAFPHAGDLRGCENDAIEMERIAIANNFETHEKLLGPDATYIRVLTKIRTAATQLGDGDIFFFTFAGHGFQETDIGSNRDELDNLDETLVLFDAQLFDDVLRKDLWPCFAAGVRILMIADSCHSGTVFLVPDGEDNGGESLQPDEFPVSSSDDLARTISDATARMHQIEYGEFYRRILQLPIYKPTINANVLLLAACEDHDTTADGFPNGAYTAAMMTALKEDPANYDELSALIQAELDKQGHKQKVRIEETGQSIQNFRNGRPFSK